MIGARRLTVICATSLALASLTLACGRYGPPVRPVPSGSSSTSGDSGTFDNTPNAHPRPAEAVPYILQGLVLESAASDESRSQGPTERTIEQADKPDAEPGPEKKAQPDE